MSETTLKQPMAINEFLSPSGALPSTPGLKSDRGQGSAMNEELKPSALSSGLMQADTKQVERQSFATAHDLNSFLIRRQLLTIESKRIQELLLETEAELTARQANLVDIRDRVLATLRDHLNLQDELARVESLRRQRLENLPRTVERYIRRRAKKLFAYRKPHASTGITDRPVATRVQDPGWRLPKVRRLDAWAAWFAENRSQRAQGATLSKRSDPGRFGR